MFIVQERSFGAVIGAMAVALLVNIGAFLLSMPPAANRADTAAPAAAQHVEEPNRERIASRPRLYALTLWRG